MTIRWTEKEYREYLKRTGKTKSEKKKPVKVVKSRPAVVEEIKGGIKVTLYRVHPSLNRWTKWDRYKVAEEKKSWEEELFYLLSAYRHMQLARAQVQIVYFLPGVVPDRDNYTPKFVMDGLVKAGVLVDDNETVVKPEWSFKRAKQADKRTEISIYF